MVPVVEEEPLQERGKLLEEGDPGAVAEPEGPVAVVRNSKAVCRRNVRMFSEARRLERWQDPCPKLCSRRGPARAPGGVAGVGQPPMPIDKKIVLFFSKPLKEIYGFFLQRISPTFSKNNGLKNFSSSWMK